MKLSQVAGKSSPADCHLLAGCDSLDLTGGDVIHRETVERPRRAGRPLPVFGKWLLAPFAETRLDCGAVEAVDRQTS
jgi:hypothetical protein